MLNETTSGFNDLHPLSPNHSSSLFRSTSPTVGIDDVTTIFVVGFPEDMAEREFQNMFIFCRGFEAASLKWHCKDQEEDNNLASNNNSKKQMIGFARFRTKLEALEAIEVLNGKKIDGDKGTVLKAEMAKKNLHIKKTLATQTTTTASTSSSTTGSSNRYDSFSPLPSDLFQNEYMDSMLTLNESLFGIRSPSIDQFTSRSFTQFHIHPQQQQQQQLHRLDHNLHYLSKSLPVPTDDLIRVRSTNTIEQTVNTNNSRLANPADQNPPCNTLYVGNLPPNTQEDELKQIFSVCKGYHRMCFRSKPQGPMCFVEFDDVHFASQALHELQGFSLSNSVKGGIRLSFSKNPLFIKPSKESKHHFGSNNNRDFIF